MKYNTNVPPTQDIKKNVTCAKFALLIAVTSFKFYYIINYTYSSFIIKNFQAARFCMCQAFLGERFALQ